VADPAAANGFVVSNEIVPSAQNIFNNAPWGTVTAEITLTSGTSATVVTASASATTTSQPSSRTTSASSSQLARLSADAGAATQSADHLGSSVASLDQTNLPAFAPVSGAGVGLLANYIASGFGGGSSGFGVTPLIDPASCATTQALPLISAQT
jgi:hypothetical protein